jgi:hypothetical protein
MDTIAAGARFIAERKISSALSKLLYQFLNGFRRIRDLTKVTHLAAIGFRD